MKPWLIILIVLLVLLLIAGGVLCLRWYLQSSRVDAPSNGGVMDGPGMLAEEPEEIVLCEYSCTGGMENELYILTLTRIYTPTESRAELTFERYRNPDNWSSAVTSTYKLPADAMAGFYDIFDRYDMAHWPEELDKEEWEVLDAPSVTVTIQTRSRTYTIHDDDVVPGGGPLFRDVREALEALLPERAKR